MDTTYIGMRITELRLKKDISEYQLSYDLGHNKNYIRAITSGRTLPSVRALFDICEYFEISLAQFFDNQSDPYLEIIKDEMKPLSEDDKLVMVHVFQVLCKRFQKDKN